MDLTKEALRFLTEVERETVAEDSKGQEYLLEGYTPIIRKAIEPITTHTLDSVVEYVNKNSDKFEENIIHIVDPETVCIYSEIIEDSRDTLMIARAFVSRLSDGWRDTEEFNLYLQSNFINTDDRRKLLTYIGRLKDEKVKNYSDDGISQTVTVKTGVATIGDAILPNPVNLAPYRSFPEIEQVESAFIFRMKDGPEALLKEADGMLWKIEAIDRIKNYLKSKITPGLVARGKVKIYG